MQPHNGRIVKLIGDGTIVEFASVVDAVTCALLQIDALNAGLFLSAALFCQGFFSPKRYARGDRPRNNIAYFPRWSDQQAKFAEDQMGLFEVGCCGRLGHRFLDASFTSAIRGYLNALGPK